MIIARKQICSPNKLQKFKNKQKIFKTKQSKLWLELKQQNKKYKSAGKFNRN